MKIVRFLVPHRLYNAGEVAGFPAAQADALIAAGTAVAELVAKGRKG
jgi:hypothetical protein